MNFCDYCRCRDCTNGTSYISHAQTDSGRWICSTCYAYDLCTSGPNRNPGGPCDNKICPHRPKIISEWTKLDK